MPINGITGAGGGVGGWLFRGGAGAFGASATPAEGTSSGSNTTPASGLAPGNGWVYHTFTGPGTFSVTSAGEAQIFALGGGGGAAGHAASGGGGSGGLVYDARAQLSPGSYTIDVGDGGGRGPNHSTSYNGNASTVSGNGTTWTGARGGKSGAYSAGTPGGSGGGHAGYPPGNRGSDYSNAPYGSDTTQYGQSNPSSSLNFGNRGGGCFGPTHHAGGGGGGLGADGRFAPSPTLGGRGGPGIKFKGFMGPLIGLPGLGSSGGFGGGGGAGAWSGENGAPGGEDGGGTGRISYSPTSNPGGENGTQYMGGGGGGGNGPTSPGGGGGKGLVVIRYRQSAVQGGDGSTSSTPIRFAADLAGVTSSGNKWIQTPTMGEPAQFWVDTTMSDGPWIRAYVAPVGQNTVDATWTGTGGSAEIPGLLASASSFVYSFVNVNDGSNTNAWSWWFTEGWNEKNYGEFIGNPPQRHGDYQKPLWTRINTKQLSSGSVYNGYWLRTSVTSFSSYCDSSRGGTWGQICLRNNNGSSEPPVGSNNSSSGFSDFPMHTGFATNTGAADYCVGSNASYSSIACSSTKRFAIHCNIHDPNP